MGMLQDNGKRKGSRRKSDKKDLYPILLALENTRGIGKKIAEEFIENYKEALKG